jgi:light-regulated signal transduction histidine kinase (bacteriophytochrome)
VSHDLRAPLRHISGYVNLLSSRFQADLPDKAKSYLDTINDSARQMGNLIDDLLQFSRTGRQEMRECDIDMQTVLQDAIETLRIEANAHAVEWRIASLPTVHGDRSLLQLVWQNLLGNALKFTRTRARAEITVNVREEEDSYVFSIGDNGVGFDMRYAHKLFGVFQRLHSTDDFEGTGIGLANVRRIIQKHGGRTWAKAELDAGATFFFSLPKSEGTHP